MPPLRQRDNDVLLLAQTFLERCQAGGPTRVVGFKSAAAERLMAYPWPGNVRELQNCIERAIALSQFDHIGIDDLPERIRNFNSSRIALESGDPLTIVPMEEIERRYIMKVLEALAGNKASAARLLGMDRRTLYRKLERWGNAPAQEPERREHDPEGRIHAVC
jgi:two-component system response regulator HydG